MSQSFDTIVVGAGIFGASVALELSHRGLRVAVIDPGPLPHPLASSTDISKVIRIEYSDDEEYALLAEQSRERWLEWNEWFGEELYHEVGVVMLTRTPMAPGEYEYENYQSLIRRGYQPERIDRKTISSDYPAFNAELYVDGYFHGKAGYAESGRVVAAILAMADRGGVTVLPGHSVTLLQITSGRIQSVQTSEGESFTAGQVVISAGAWTPYLLPELKPFMKSVGMPVFHLKPSEPSLFVPPRLAVFSADITRTGWYGFPLHPTEGIVKIANHGGGITVHPIEDERTVTELETTRLREFLADSMPALANAPIVYSRRCLYCDTLDEHFWIDRHPEIEGLTVAAGGSGHAFKFGPLLGGWIADTVEGKPNPKLSKFRWRELDPNTLGEEASRYRGDLQ